MQNRMEIRYLRFGNFGYRKNLAIKIKFTDK